MTAEKEIEELKKVLRQTGHPVCFMDFETDPEDTDEDGKAYPPCIAIVLETETTIFADSSPVLESGAVTLEFYISSLVSSFAETRKLERLLEENDYAWGNKKRKYLREEKIWLITYQLSEIFYLEMED